MMHLNIYLHISEAESYEKIMCYTGVLSLKLKPKLMTQNFNANNNDL